MSGSTDRWRVDEDDATRRARIEREIHAILGADERRAGAPPAPACTSAWYQRLVPAFLATKRPAADASPSADQPATGEHEYATDGDGDGRPRYYARPTVGDVVISSSAPETTQARRSEGLLQQRVVSWRELPPCPLPGYTLDRRGLWDTAARPSKLLAADDVQLLARECGRVSSATSLVATRVSDDALVDRLNNRFSRGMPLVGSWAGLVIIANTVRLMQFTSARRSILFARRWTPDRYSQHELERLAQRFRWPLLLTVPSIAAQLALGGTLVALGCFCRVPDDIDKKTSAGQNHAVSDADQRSATALAKYMWSVYYNHPAYTAPAPQRAA